VKKILLVWYMEEDNFGDTLLADTSHNILKENNFCIEYHEVGDSYKNIIQHANNCDFLLFAGGGIIERYIPDIIRNFGKVYSLLEVPYGVIGLSIGGFIYDAYETQLGKWVDNSAFFFSRDNYTADILNRYAILKKVICSNDCVFLNSRIERNNIPIEEKIGINIRNMPYEDITGALNVDSIKRIYEEKNAMLIMDSSKELLRIDNSEKTCKSYMEYLEKNKIEKAEQIIEQVADCKYIIAMRYHVILVAATMGIPTIPIAYCPKVERLSQNLGLKNLIVYPNRMDELEGKIIDIQKNDEKYREIMCFNVKKAKMAVQEMYKNVIDIIKKEIG